jgi:ABC-2 type transport system permease protein
VRTLRSVLGQVRNQSIVAGRNRLLVFFSLALPVLLFFLFQFVIDGDVTIGGQTYTVPQFFGPSIASYGVATGTYAYLAMNTAATRQEGILKRLRGTPLPAPVYMAGRIGSAVAGGGAASALVLTIAVVFYDLHIAAVAIPAIAATFLVGAVAFGALGLAVASFAPNADAAVAIANATLLPAAFVSSVFVPLEHPSTLVKVLGSLLPLKPFSLAFQHAVHATSFTSAFDWGRILVVACWGIAGAFLALRFFMWEPKPPRDQRRARRPSAQPPGTVPSVRT